MLTENIDVRANDMILIFQQQPSSFVFIMKEELHFLGQLLGWYIFTIVLISINNEKKDTGGL